MYTPRKIFVILAIVGSAVTVSACSTAATPGTTGSSSSASAAFNKADISFATDMAAHHQQAVEMSQMLLDKSDIDPRVVTLAQEIKAAQAQEVAVRRLPATQVTVKELLLRVAELERRLANVAPVGGTTGKTP